MMGLMALTLFSCARQPGVYTVSLSFTSSPELLSTQLNNHAQQPATVMVRTDALPADVISKAASAKLFIGSQPFQGHFFPVEGDTYYQFNAGNRCDAHLEGNDVTFQYKVYDQAGHVLQQKAVTVPHIDGC